MNGPSVDAFNTASTWLRDGFDADVRVVLDSGCGTGMSTRNLARLHPDAAVIGVDRSAARLGKSRGVELPDNALLVQAELATFWRLLLEADFDAAEPGLSEAAPLKASRVARHWMLYPNPYPKPARLNLRWHGHPSLPCLLAIGDEIEVRSNWRVYLDEFETATSLLARRAGGGAESDDGELSMAGLSLQRQRTLQTVRNRVGRLGVGNGAPIEALRLASVEDAITPFEAKFHANGEALWRLAMRRGKV